MAGDADPDDLIGAVLASRYRLEARLGHGAMGTVYRARHVEVGRPFAIKVLHRRLLGDDRTRKRFAREAALAGSLHHDNVVNVIDVGELPDGRCYLVMEYADGPTLYDLIVGAAPMPGARVISIVRQLCSGLHHAHELGLIHRDFKPDNVIVERDRYGTDTPKIVDFGVAILREDVKPDARRLTSAGLVLGTPHYMAPEHATGKPIDHRIDLFALGVTCFEMLTGRAPFDGDGVALARANLLFATPAMTVRVPGLQVDPLLEAFTRKLMRKARDERPATARAAGELIDLIDHDRRAAAAVLGVRLSERRSFAALPVTLAPPPPAWIATIPSRPTGLVVASAAGLMVIAAMVIVLGQRRPAAATAPRIAATLPLDAGPLDAAPPAAPPSDEPRSAPATSASVAQLYARLGRQLKALDEAPGSAATADLWPPYLRIRIDDVIGDPAKRDEAAAVLHDLEDQIPARAR